MPEKKQAAPAVPAADPRAAIIVSLDFGDDGFAFRLTPRTIGHFESRSQWLQHDPESSFVRVVKGFRFAEDGRLFMLRGAVLTTLSVSLPAPTVVVGNTATATATGVDQFGASIATGTVTWSTGDAAVATVNGNGVVMGVGLGQTQVVATAGGKTAQAPVTVSQVPIATIDVTPLTATLVVGEVYDGHLGNNQNIWSVGSRHTHCLRTTENPINTPPGTGVTYNDGGTLRNGAFMSRHTNGANFLLGDGSVRFLSQNIDITQYRTASTIRGGEVTNLP